MHAMGIYFVGDNPDPINEWHYDPKLFTIDTAGTRQNTIQNRRKIWERVGSAYVQGTANFGRLNILTGVQSELAPWLAGHMDVNALDLSGADGDTAELERLAAENVKRIVRGRTDGHSLWEISPFLELKTVWHPIGV